MRYCHRTHRQGGNHVTTLTITAEQVLASAERIREDIVRDRRTLHAAPEVGNDLPNTVAYVKNACLRWAISRASWQAGVVAEITGTETGRCSLLRADMDALCVTEQTGLDFASANGCMHACGHDMHAASAFGAAQLLQEYGRSCKVRSSWCFSRMRKALPAQRPCSRRAC